MANRTCMVCGIVFEQMGRGRPATTCSKEHREELSRRRANAWHYSHYVPSTREPVSQTCTRPDCPNPNSGGGVCAMHRARMKKYGTYDLPDVPCGLCGAPSGRQGFNIKKAYCETCQPLAKAKAHVQWRADNPERLAVLREREILARYGLTPATRDALLVEQGGTCAICPKVYVPAERQHWHIDHDPTRGPHAVRGILCRRCNQEIGKFEHDPALLRAAADYLVRARLKS